ncbi:hypothetical protein K438DRAFT_1832229 [Mycena galopus ATCC 62051]|nr:hypothetical protein K438DRAFT_1832229 [Mycena galopus ATCC 62051]
MDHTYSPILTLPPEITAEIFSHYVGIVVHGIFWKGHGPLRLATVCKSWREISFSTHSLWASVLINDECNWNDPVNLNFLQRWISRAGNHPLDLCLIQSESPDLVPLLSRHSSQWRSLRLTLDSSNILALNSMGCGRVPSLTKLSVAMPVPGLPANVTAFREAPSLREVSLSNLGSLQSIALPWIQLTHLKVSNISQKKCLDILKETPNLEVLGLSVYLKLYSPSSSSTLNLAHLHTIIFYNESQANLILGCLTLPAIRTLHFSFLTSSRVARLLELGLRSSWSPRSLRLGFTEHDLANRYLRSLPSLEKVEIIVCPDLPTPATLTPLVELLANDGDFLPNLRGLTIHDYPLGEVFSTGLVEMLSARWRAARLKSFHLSFSPRLGVASVLDEIKSRVRPLMDEGLEVVVRIGIMKPIL